MVEIVIEDRVPIPSVEDGVAAARPAERILAPWARDLPKARVDLLGVLPVIGANETALAAIEAADGAARGGTLGLFLADPFLRTADLAERLHARRIARVANLPTLQVVDGEAARALDAAGLGVARELAALAALGRHGLALLPFVASLPAARTMLEAGAGTLVLHPGLALEDWRMRAASALALGQWLQSLRREAPGCRLLLYCPPGFGDELRAPAASADGIVRWRTQIGEGAII